MVSNSLNAYFAKLELNYQELLELIKTDPHEALKRLYYAHVTHFPYNNIELRESSSQHPVHRQPLTFFNSPRMMKAGGYCFQSTALLYSVLTSLGYAPVFCEARILMGSPVNDAAILKLPVTHVVLKVAVDDMVLLLEPSLGMQTPRYPIQIDGINEPIIQYKDDFRFYQEQGQYVLEKKMKGRWLTLMQTDLQQASIEVMAMNLSRLQWFPGPIGIRDEKTMVALVTDRGSKALFWDIHSSSLRYWLQEDDTFTSRVISDWDEAVALLWTEFKIASSKLHFESCCRQACKHRPIRRWEIELPITSSDWNEMRSNVAFQAP
ncbi:MAG: N-hydroxyarylamine O-acetyltransferase [Legionella sp.]|nr:MAG: N-hydroxyarylamine O-acetyltransferase [Legionella sp.]PJD98804.1 MAG: N-hydroxyarylamine O-acetyltransferase [Legionella sp.]